MKRILHLTTHLNIGGITSYIKLVTKEMLNEGYSFYVGSSGGTQEQVLAAQGVTCVQFNIRTKSEISPKVFLAISPLIEFIRREKIDLIHAHTRVTQILAWWVQRFTKIPYVSTCHGFYKRRLGRKLIPAWGNHVVAISKPVEDSLIHDFRVSEEKVSTVFNAIDIPELLQRYREKDPKSIRRELRLPESCQVVGIIARIVADKGHEFFLRAAQRLLRGSFPKIKILIVGEGPDMKRMQQLARKLKIEHSVLFLGNMQDVTYPLAVIDVFVLPAVWREGFGLSIIEAMAVCKPVIVTNIWALNELVQNKVNGLLVEPKDVDGLAAAMGELLSDEELHNRVAMNGCQMVKETFSIVQMSSSIHRIYTQVLSQETSSA